MSITFRTVWQAAAFRSDLSVTGVGPHSTERVTDSEWRSLLNSAVKTAWRAAASARPDFQVVSQDFTITSGNSSSFTVPAQFFDVVDVVFAPDTTNEYSLGPFAWQNRRSPGGWFPANFGGSANLGGNVARLMGSSIYIEPSLRAGGTYRLWYCPQPKLIRADTTVTVATTAALPTYGLSGPTGLGRTLTGSVSGTLTIDGVAPTVGQTVLVQNEATGVNNGIYAVSQNGPAVPYILIRTNVTTLFSPTLGAMVQVLSGTVNADLFFETTTLTTVVDVTPWFWTEAFIEPQLEQFSELLELETAIPAMQRDDDLDPKPLILRARGNDGQSGLVGELKTYFRQVRTASGPSRMIDTDSRGPRSPWSL